MFRSRLWICLIAFSLDVELGAERAAARDCASAAEAAACASNEDCACGTNAATGQCDVAVAECVSGDACERFCSGYGYDLGAVCRQEQCTRARRTRCPGDCDGDVSVDVAELVTGVGIALGARPLAACQTLDQNGDGSTRVDEMISAVRAALGGCAAAVAPIPGARGTYDAVVTSNSDTGGPVADVSEAVADVYDNEGDLRLDIHLAPNIALDVSGPLDGEEVTLDGSYWVTDYGISISGTARVRDDATQEVIEGSLQGEPGIGSTALAATFVLRHSRTVTPQRFAGRYRFEFAQSPRGNGLPSSVDLVLQIAAGGTTLTTEGRDLGAGGELFGTVTAGECRIAPEGHFSCYTLYLLADSVLSTPLRLTGAVSGDGTTVTGSGRFLSGIDPPFGPEPYVSSSWTAVRTSAGRDE